MVDREEVPAAVQPAVTLEADQETADQAEEILPVEAAEAIPVEVTHHHRHLRRLRLGNISRYLIR